MELALKRTFGALKVRNFRLFVIGQAISLSGTWMQTIGLSWLVLEMTHSGTQLGLVIAAQFLPILIFGAWGGLVADRFDKRHILYFTQSSAGILALILGLLVLTGAIQLWMVYVLALALGFVNVIDMPSRQAFVMEMVGPKLLKNAVTLNSTMTNAARLIGPTIAGVLIATSGVTVCFLANAVSYIAVLAALHMMLDHELFKAPIVTKVSGQLRAGLSYAWSEPKLKATLLMMLIIGTFAYEFPVIFPLFATITLHGNAGTYSAMMAAMGAGAIIGGLYTAGHSDTSEKPLILIALLFGGSIILTALMPNLIAVLIVLIIMGALSVLFIALGNTTLQLTSKPEMRGRIMSLWVVAFSGTTPIGGPIIGYISDHSNPRIGLMVGGGSALIAAILGYIIYSRANSRLILDNKQN
jgi:MFS family permease